MWGRMRRNGLFCCSFTLLLILSLGNAYTSLYKSNKCGQGGIQAFRLSGGHVHFKILTLTCALPRWKSPRRPHTDFPLDRVFFRQFMKQENGKDDVSDRFFLHFSRLTKVPPSIFSQRLVPSNHCKFNNFSIIITSTVNHLIYSGKSVLPTNQVDQSLDLLC